MLSRRLFTPASSSRYSTRAAYRAFSTSNATSKSVIVTGAAQGIGRAIALQLADDGYDVCVNDVDSKKQALEEVRLPISVSLRNHSRRVLEAICNICFMEKKSKEGSHGSVLLNIHLKVCHNITTTHSRKAIPVTADVTSYESVENLVQTSVRNLGPLSTMVANAGIVRTPPSLHRHQQNPSTNKLRHLPHLRHQPCRPRAHFQRKLLGCAHHTHLIPQTPSPPTQRPPH